MTVTWSRRSYTKEEFVDSWNSSRSIAECARKLGILGAGGNYTTLRLTAESLGLTRAHMTGQGWNVGNIMGLTNSKPLEEILVENSSHTHTSSLKKRLLSLGILENKCYAPYCPLAFENSHPFTGLPVPLKLALDHINGKRQDNRIENLRLLCYYCHGLTDTYCGLNTNTY